MYFNVTANYLTVIDAGPPGAINVKNPGSSLQAASGDGTTDDTRALRRIFNHAATQTNTKVFFPPGKYHITSDVTIKGNSTMVLGSEVGMSIIMTQASDVLTTTMGNLGGRFEQHDVALKYLFFDGIRVHFIGRRGVMKHGISISHCVFFASQSPPTGAVLKPQVRFRYVSDSHPALSYSVFLRESAGFGVASQFRESENYEIRKNIFGLDLGKTDWMGNVWTDSYWDTLRLKLQFLKSDSSLADDQGYFKSSIYDDRAKNSVIEENIFNGSPNFVGTATYHHDHVVYLKGFDGTRFVRNYARGWPSDPTGGIKARNGKSLTIARNYIDDTGILLYTHYPASPTDLHLGLKDVLVYGNHIVERTNIGHRASGISYYEPNFTGADENLVYSANTFEIVNPPASLTHPPCISLTNGDVSQHKVYDDNVYQGTNNSVTLAPHRNGNPVHFESNPVDHALVAPYSSMSVPNYNIPTYTTTASG